MKNLWKLLCACAIAAGALSCTKPVQEGKVTGVTVEPEELVLEVNSSAVLEATVFPSDAVEQGVMWSSDNESVVTVDGTGTVTAVAAGSAKVTAVTVDGGFSASCAVTVNEESSGQVLEDLSSSGTANCYVIDSEGLYSFNVKTAGNGIGTDGHEGALLFDQATYASLVWQTDPGMILSVTFDGGAVLFEASDVPGNALIAVEDSDENIIWSWHIWHPKEEISSMTTKTGYELMNMNLGAMTSGQLPLENSESYGLLYQWGRKDPFTAAATVTGDETTMGAPLYDIEGNAVSIGASSMSSVADNTLEYSIAHPTVCLSNYAQYSESRDWLAAEHSDASLWGNPDGNLEEDGVFVNKGFKTMYDPCPPGWRVPPADVFGSFTSSGQVSFSFEEFDVEDISLDGKIDADDFSNGWFFKMEEGSMFFPAAARYDGSYAMLMGSVSGLWGSYWSNAPGSADFGYGGLGFCALSFQSSMVTPSASASRADAYSVRCIRE